MNNAIASVLRMLGLKKLAERVSPTKPVVTPQEGGPRPKTPPAQQ